MEAQLNSPGATTPGRLGPRPLRRGSWTKLLGFRGKASSTSQSLHGGRLFTQRCEWIKGGRNQKPSPAPGVTAPGSIKWMEPAPQENVRHPLQGDGPAWGRKEGVDRHWMGLCSQKSQLSVGAPGPALASWPSLEGRRHLKVTLASPP